jgi:hypothetical protein
MFFLSLSVTAMRGDSWSPVYAEAGLVRAGTQHVHCCPTDFLPATVFTALSALRHRRASRFVVRTIRRDTFVLALGAARLVSRRLPGGLEDTAGKILVVRKAINLLRQSEEVHSLFLDADRVYEIRCPIRPHRAWRHRSKRGGVIGKDRRSCVLDDRKARSAYVPLMSDEKKTLDLDTFVQRDDSTELAPDSVAASLESLMREHGAVAEALRSSLPGPAVGKAMREFERMQESLRSIQPQFAGLQQVPESLAARLTEMNDLLLRAGIWRDNIASVFPTAMESLLTRAEEQARIFRDSLGLAAIDGGYIKALEGIRPTRSALDTFFEDHRRQFEELSRAFAPLSGWGESLQRQLTGIDIKWALRIDAAGSMLGFAELSRLNLSIRTIEPFSHPLGEILQGALGDPVGTAAETLPLERDEQAVRQGLSPNLIQFPPIVYTEVVSAAGFDLHFELPAVPVAIENNNEEAVFAPKYSGVLLTVEQEVRQLVERRLAQAAGPKWVKQRVPEHVRNRWAERQNEDRETNRPVYTEIQYSDFMDLADVVTRNDNWPVFASIFGTKEQFRLSMQRLHPVRKVIAHNRPLSRSDVVTLVSEAFQLMRALGMPL